MDKRTKNTFILTLDARLIDVWFFIREHKVKEGQALYSFSTVTSLKKNAFYLQARIDKMEGDYDNSTICKDERFT